MSNRRGARTGGTDTTTKTNTVQRLKKTDKTLTKSKPTSTKKQRGLKDGCCANCSWKKIWIGFAVILAILTLIVVIFSVVFSASQNGIQRFCGEALPENVVPGPGEVGNKVPVEFLLDSTSNEISYRIRYPNTLSAIQAVHVRGPIPIGSETGNLKFPLCGSPSSTVCDITTTPGEIVGTLVQIDPGGTDVRPEILNIRKEPLLYYIEILTVNFPATPGALRMPLYSICGTP